jgi:hypothetical protein
MSIYVTVFMQKKKEEEEEEPQPFILLKLNFHSGKFS